MNKKGFTLIEILVVLLIMIAVFTFFSASYGNAKKVRQNERAKAMFAEVANAARLYNEAYPNHKIYGIFGSEPSAMACPNCHNPCRLFKGYALFLAQGGTPAVLQAAQNIEDTISPYALRPYDWHLTDLTQCSNSLNYEGYTFVFCNPNMTTTSTQPHEDCVGTEGPRFALMLSPNDEDTLAKYKGKTAWITNGYEMGNNYLMN